VRRREMSAPESVPAWVRRFDPDEWQVGLVVRDPWPNVELGWRYEAWRRWVHASHEYREVHGIVDRQELDEEEERLWESIEDVLVSRAADKSDAGR
jgi:hypothetical protein